MAVPVSSFVNPVKIARGFQFLASSFARRHFLAQCLGEQEFLQHCLGHQDYLRTCFAHHDQIAAFIGNRLKLSKLTVDEGSLPYPEELDGIKELVGQANRLKGPIIEIGTLFGFTTSRMAVWKSPAKKIVTVDCYLWNPWGVNPETHQALTRQFLHFLVETGQVEIVCMDKNEFYATYQGEPPALVFLDADHTYEPTRQDIQWARRVGARIIAGHDYGEGFPGVKRAVDEAGGPAGQWATVWALPTPDFQPPACQPDAA
jgi:hypothetical protein